MIRWGTEQNSAVAAKGSQALSRSAGAPPADMALPANISKKLFHASRTISPPSNTEYSLRTYC